MAGTGQIGTLVAGGVALVGSIVVGKIVVDAIQGDEVREPGERSALDESVRLVASLLGISVSLLHLPQAWEEAQKLVQSQALPPTPPTP